MILILVSQFNKDITDRLLAGAKKAADEEKLPYEVMEVPGAFELPYAAKKAAVSRKYKGVIVLGAVIKGETDHYKAVCEGVTYGIQKVSIEQEIPIMFGVLMCAKKEQALKRSDDTENNKGYECVKGLIEILIDNEATG